MRGYRINFEIWDFLLYEAMQSKTGRLMRTCKGGGVCPPSAFLFLIFPVPDYAFAPAY